MQRGGKSYVKAASCNGMEYVQRKAYNYASIVLYALVVAGSVIMQDTKEIIEKACIDMRMHNERAEVVKL